MSRRLIDSLAAVFSGVAPGLLRMPIHLFNTVTAQVGEIRDALREELQRRAQ